MNGVPSLTLPSISEDDENLHEEGETSPLSPNRSPIHAVTNSPRHPKLSRYDQYYKFISVHLFKFLAIFHLASFYPNHCPLTVN